MDSRLTRTHYKILQNIAVRNGMKDCEVKVDDGAEKGEHYMGTILSITLIDRSKKLRFILKCCLQNTQKVIPSREYCLKEIFIYDIVLPYFSKFEKEFKVTKPFKSYVRCYGTCEDEENECMILENLFRNGYKMWNRKLLMDAEHISLVMSELGKFHAASFGMKTKFPDFFREKFEYLIEPNSEIYNKNFENFMNSSLGVIGRAIQGNVGLEKWYKKFVTEFPKFLSVDLNNHEDKMVIIHGDAWCNNMMFKYEVSIFIVLQFL